MPNLILYIYTVLFQAIQFSISTQFKCQNSSISNNSDLGAMAVMGYTAFPKTPASQGPFHQIPLGHIQDTLWDGVLSIFREAVGVFYHPRRLGKFVCLEWTSSYENVFFLMRKVLI